MGKITYIIPMVFKKGGKINYRDYQKQFDAAMNEFNRRAKKVNKARKILKVETTENQFNVFLESWDTLQNPSKALNVFSQTLATMQIFKDFLDSQRHLLRNNGKATVVVKKAEVIINDCKLIQTLTDIVLGGELNESIQKKYARKEAKENVTRIAKEYMLL
ncbi:hypothetical protein [Clostridium autoethanogenum]|uniref:Uncharacterized protein n=1 Tax=Clostridium autoethanogenum DSM 10061 TaxID=1341692 RepID=A0ABM5NU21_9CLOT|nr:hypothetical protein [Clostridium autoethanogenum]AGY75867.1 hypothetical protein CAETHG_1646 [Clostridium autoethanogenum DSM 10061]ALU36033.1 Hypothetical protein CLAU_1604 [Clostridium autoethanogenum DSM 10061]OVY51909.1 hypothetical protein WX72_00786 [Clostridium autoethanogenum]DAD54169.1 TPA_exp: protein of unknown function KV_050 [Clostridium autoethanogenum DSM 10061]